MKFYKMHGLGNDFIIINAINENISIDKLNIKKLANRNIGIGFDQLLLLQPSKNADVLCKIYNSDGSEASQCGNGMRCVARFLHEQKLKSGAKLSIETISGIVDANIDSYDKISVEMGEPSFSTNEKHIIKTPNNKSFESHLLSIGNDHLIVFVDKLDMNHLSEINNLIQNNFTQFNGINAGFAEILDKNNIELKTFERGAGKTLACGSNACAAVCAGIKNNKLNNKVKVSLPHGNLLIEWSGNDQDPVMMTGPASYVYCGEI